MQIQLATFPILMYLACRAKLERILDSSSTSRRYRIYLVRPVPRIFTIQRWTIWNITRISSPTKKSTRIEISILIRRLEAKRMFRKRVNLIETDRTNDWLNSSPRFLETCSLERLVSSFLLIEINSPNGKVARTSDEQTRLEWSYANFIAQLLREAMLHYSTDIRRSNFFV